MISGCFGDLLISLQTLSELIKSPIGWAVVLGSLGLFLLSPRNGRQSAIQGTTLDLLQSIKHQGNRLLIIRWGVLPIIWCLEVFVRYLGIVFSIASFCLFAWSLAPFGSWAGRNLFWVMAAVTVVSAGATISMRSPVYSAIWFAMTLLGTAGLFFQQGSQFLAVATIVVYAGAILVTFLFVLMLAKPEGQAICDRISWGRLPAVLSSLVGASIVGILTVTLAHLGDGTADSLNSRSQIQESLASEQQVTAISQDVNAEEHMAHLGAELFSRHLVSIEVAGSLLLAALVGAIAIVIQGNDRQMEKETAEDE